MVVFQVVQQHLAHGAFTAAPEPMGAQDCLNYLCASKAINSSLVMV